MTPKSTEAGKTLIATGYRTVSNPIGRKRTDFSESGIFYFQGLRRGFPDCEMFAVGFAVSVLFY
jgi:hypothetical protein